MEFQCSYYTIREYVKNYRASTWHIKKYHAALEGVKILRTMKIAALPREYCPSLTQYIGHLHMASFYYKYQNLLRIDLSRIRMTDHKTID